mgnify:CR=1 FL=1|tara:strand:+ start:1159 stop:1779 length:621 start_codon:yes stop_codon:yes gene_type:complete
MPRKASDKIITHRIEFSPKERELVDTIIDTQKENQRLDAITSTLNAAGVAIGGSGALIAALGLAAWFGFSVKDKIKDVFEDLKDDVSDFVPFTGMTKDELGQAFLDKMGINPNDLDARRRDLMNQSARFCNTNSQYYDPTECARVRAEQDQLTQEYKDLQRRAQLLVADGDTDGSLLWGINTLSRRYTGLNLFGGREGGGNRPSWL